VSNANCGAFSVAVQRVDAVFEGTTTAQPTIAVTLTRPGLSLLFPVLVTISFVGIFFSEVWIIWMFYLSGWRKNDNPTLLSVLGSIVFALPTLRNASNLAPLGSSLDYYAFFWAEAMAIVSLVVLVFNYWGDARPAPPPPPPQPQPQPQPQLPSQDAGAAATAKVEAAPLPAPAAAEVAPIGSASDRASLLPSRHEPEAIEMVSLSVARVDKAEWDEVEDEQPELAEEASASAIAVEDAASHPHDSAAAAQVSVAPVIAVSDQVVFPNTARARILAQRASSSSPKHVPPFLRNRSFGAH
jgi:hypothetical protein